VIVQTIWATTPELIAWRRVTRTESVADSEVLRDRVDELASGC
jgi:hypothetical protein